MPSAAAAAPRSLLEEMLDSLQKRVEKPKDAPPALPARPPSRGRLPSARRSVNLRVESNVSQGMSKISEKQDMKDGLVFGGGIFGWRRKAKGDQLEESPYVNASGYPAIPSSEACQIDNDDYVLKKKLLVWCQLEDAKWELGKVQSIAGEDANILLCDGKIMKVSRENLLPANPDVLDGVDDLIRLGYLNEPSVLHNIKFRYSHDLVYTKAGPVLVAINPFKKVPLYGDDLIAAYRQKKMDHPHVYAITDSAFNEMMRDGTNQSIIISGESGAGKSETAKITMEYLAVLGGSNGLEYGVLQTSPILEAFGNAKTSQNDNSSRFGKLTEIHFDRSGRICGAKIQTFLLEESRVVQRAKGERSYHVFYQLCAGASPLLKEKLNLRTADEYEYLKQSGCLRIDDVDDAQKFHMLMQAFDVVQISEEDQESAFAMLAAVLWLGNIAFSTIDNENHVEVVLGEGVTNVAKLLGCEVADLMIALSTCKVQRENDRTVQKLTLSEAIDTRDALAKSIYSCLFDWLVERINKSFEAGNSCAGKFISILDIYGFQSLQKNSFEQFCINYANERLQQHFYRHSLKLEQEEYNQDGIEWPNFDFMDNIECLNLFEKKLGLFSLLDEESTQPKATDLSFANKIKQHLDDHPCFKGDRGCAFRIRHYAGEVLYHTNGFLEKNRGPLHSDSIQLLLSCGCQLPQLFGAHEHLGSVNSQKQSIGTVLKGQIFNLMQQLENTTPHFIRCIKPNNKQLPGTYENEHVLQQLRCCGVLEIVRMSRSSYPTRMTHQQFSERFGFLLLENIESQDPLSVSVSILQKLNILPEMYQVGYTKLFFRAGQIAALEDIRSRTIQGALVVQKRIRGLHARRNYRQMKKGATTTQQKKRVKEQPQMQPTASKDLQRRVQKAEEALRLKEEEVVTLQHQIKQYETRCSEYETKVKSKEEMWQKNVSSLQTNLAAAKKNLADASPVHHDYDSESAISTASRTPQATPARQPRASDTELAMNSDGNRGAVGNLVKEFEQRSQTFEDDARHIMELKGQSGANSKEELQKLKVRFAAWKKDYRTRLHEAKAAIQKLGTSAGEKRRRRWWGKRCSKA